MQVTFNPSISNKQYKKQNPAFGRINSEWIDGFRKNASKTMEGPILEAYLNRKFNPHFVPDLVDTLGAALKDQSIKMFAARRKACENLLKELQSELPAIV